MEHQFRLFDDPARTPAGDRDSRRRHRPAPGERGVPLTSLQVEIVDRAIETMAAYEGTESRALPVRVGEVLHLPRDMEVVADLMDLLDRPTADPAWRRPSDRLAQDLHEWWQAGG